MRSITATQKVLLAGVIAVMAIAALVFTMLATKASGADDAAAQSGSSVDATSFGVFRRPVSPSDAMPAGVQKMLATVADREQVDLSRARAVATIGTSAVWLIPGPSKLCVAIPDPVDGYGIGCRSPADAAKGLLWATLVAGPDQKVGDARIALVVPDGVGAVVAVGTNGSEQQIAVSDNVAVGDISNAGTVQFSDSAGNSYSPAIPGTPAELAAQ